jgi:hypothetical protein
VDRTNPTGLVAFLWLYFSPMRALRELPTV